MGRSFFGFAGMILAAWLAGHAGEPAQRTRSGESPDLQQIVQRAGIIFLGRVEKIEWKHAPAGGTADRVRITFSVLDGVRGARTGTTIQIEEWSGLWTPGHDRYSPGETLFLFLYPRSRLGFTSPVAADAGRIEITPDKRIVLSPERAASLLPRSLRLQKQQAIAQSLRDRHSSTYVQFAQMVRDLAEVSP
jgi:hypothetical protein